MSRREDAEQLARVVRSDECGGLPRAEAAAILCWPEDSEQFRAAMFYARTAGWITFCGEYLCHPGPAAPVPRRAACPLAEPLGQQGALDISPHAT